MLIPQFKGYRATLWFEAAVDDKLKGLIEEIGPPCLLVYVSAKLLVGHCHS
jgi:hypothetical protein